MFEKRPKFSFFILGMFIGALCGGILVYYNSVITNENKISVNLIPQIVKQVIGVINNKTDNANDTIASIANSSNDGANGTSEANAENNLSNGTDTDVEDLMDSIPEDSLEVLSEESINIKKEELLAEKEVIVYPLDMAANSKQNKSDSLLAIVSGTKEEPKKGTQQKIIVELWKSPINYKGYQASKNKVIFFGLSEMEQIKLFSYKSDLILKYNETAYYIDYTNDFNGYEKVLDASLLAQINKINP